MPDTFQLSKLSLSVTIHSSLLLPTTLFFTSVIIRAPNSYLEHLADVTPSFKPLSSSLDPPSPKVATSLEQLLVRHAAIYANYFEYEFYIEPFVQRLSVRLMKGLRHRTYPIFQFGITQSQTQKKKR